MGHSLVGKEGYILHFPTNIVWSIDFELTCLSSLQATRHVGYLINSKWGVQELLASLLSIISSVSERDGEKQPCTRWDALQVRRPALTQI